MTPSWRSAIALSGVVLVLLAGTPVSAQVGASLAGVMVSDVSGEPLSGGHVSLVGADLRVDTGERGEFLIEGLPAGPIRVRFDAPGYVSVVEDVEVSVGAFFRVPMRPVDAVLDEILVRARRRPGRDEGQPVRVDRDGDEWKSVLDLLDQQVPGVVVHRSGGLGGGAYVSVRGAGTLQGDNAPDIYLDGSRVDGQNPGAWTLHTLDLIPAEDVSSVRVYKGASSGAGFALGGANGVIVIETHRGTGGSDR